METTFKGRSYRSRLEARWAVFFDTLRIDHETDVPAVTLPSGNRYRPNFRVPSLGVFVDVKPFVPFGYQELRSLWEFGVDLGHDTLLIIGSPTRHRFAVLNRRTHPALEEATAELEGATELEAANELVQAILDWGSVVLATSPFEPSWRLVYSPLPPNDDDALSEALNAAKAEPFYSGNRPAG